MVHNIDDTPDLALLNWRVTLVILRRINTLWVVRNRELLKPPCT